MESLKTLISNVLDNNESLCLDSAEDKNTLLDSIMEALNIDDKTIVSMLIAEGADVQVDNDGQFIVYTGVYEAKECYYCGDNCPNEPDDSEYMCDGFAGDIDGLYTEEAQLSVITFIILSYGLYVAVELVRRVQLLCETEHT